MIGDQHFGVSTVGNTTIPEDAIVGKLKVLAVVLLGFLAEITLQTRRRQAPDTDSISDREVLDVAPNFHDQPSNLMTRDNRIHGDTPIIPSLVKISVAYATVQYLYRNIVDPVFSAAVLV